MKRKAHRIGPYSRRNVLAKVDGRTREARLLDAARADLIAHVGGHPSATQLRLIERAAWLTLYVAMLDAKAMQSGEMTEHDSRTYLAWSNSLTRTLAALGLTGKAATPQSLAEILAAKAAEAG